MNVCQNKRKEGNFWRCLYGHYNSFNKGTRIRDI